MDPVTLGLVAIVGTTVVAPLVYGFTRLGTQLAREGRSRMARWREVARRRGLVVRHASGLMGLDLRGEIDGRPVEVVGGGTQNNQAATRYRRGPRGAVGRRPRAGRDRGRGRGRALGRG